MTDMEKLQAMSLVNLQLLLQAKGLDLSLLGDGRLYHPYLLSLIPRAWEPPEGSHAGHPGGRLGMPGSDGKRGAAMGAIDQPPTPVIFNTGQVIFGWIRAFQETSQPNYRDSATKCRQISLEATIPGRAWRKLLSSYASS